MEALLYFVPTELEQLFRGQVEVDAFEFIIKLVKEYRGMLPLKFRTSVMVFWAFLHVLHYRSHEHLKA